ncbi:hypothetical protein IOD16_23460 [Saccharothrix sp. 6-C]|uniref:Calx-beta domain-containing protein n=1 Tax=Saccharothrix sp. 6-C TaxID=2781735 RepID=UPI0019173980|nr:Calx-beta domain-containing protein [Saccharothrix sp. 6-C]QQQ74169.1 hypothetical protein IOD16_23460 [Saccharothrix sp. 6-C]
MRFCFRRFTVAVTAFLLLPAVLLPHAAAHAGEACDKLYVAIDDKAGNEGTGDEWSTTANFTVTAGGCAQTDVTVDYRTVDGTAKAPGDYTPTSGKLTWRAGTAVAQEIHVPIVRDAAIEWKETFSVKLASGSSGVVITKAEAVATIQDDDDPQHPPVVSTGGTISWVPDDPIREIPVVLSHVANVPVTVTYRTVNGTARAGEDFVGVANGHLTIPAGALTAPAVVLLAPNAVPKPGEYFFVELTSTSYGVFDNTSTKVTFAGQG